MPHLPLGRLFPFGITLIALLLGGLAACSSTDTVPVSGDPLLDLRNPALSARERSEAASVAWGEVEAGIRGRERTRATFKDLAWSHRTMPELRAQLVDHLMSDTSPEGEADSIRLAQLMLPREPSPRVAAVISHLAAARGWTELTPALIRSLADNRIPGALADRPETFALQRLYPSKSLTTIAFEVFLDPGDDPTERHAAVLRWTERVRENAWELLARLDADRADRPELLATWEQHSKLDEQTRLLLQDLSRAWASHRVMPETAMELAWLRSIQRPEYPDLAAPNAAWWGSTQQAVRSQPPTRTESLQLRHLEPLRWAAAHASEVAQLDRASLYATMLNRLKDRPRNIRSDGVARTQRRKERINDWEPQLAWADLLTLVVVDQAVRQPAVIARVFEFVELDRADRSTEYGGVIEAGSSDSPEYRAVLYKPRQSQRQGDNAFVASDDMLRFSDRALVHFHLQVQRPNNEAFAGPSQADLEYAERSGRTCVVFTSISKNRLGVDYYQPNGVVIDLGEIQRPGT